MHTRSIGASFSVDWTYELLLLRDVQDVVTFDMSARARGWLVSQYSVRVSLKLWMFGAAL
jgi:hypothetical protein